MKSFTYETTNSLEQKRKQLEKILHEGKYETAYSPSRLIKLCQKAFDWAVNWLTVENDVHIRHKIRGGREVWKVYDPISKSSRSFSTEDEVRVWIEQRFYR